MKKLPFFLVSTVLHNRHFLINVHVKEQILFDIYLLIKTSSLCQEEFRTPSNYKACDIICYKYEIHKAYWKIHYILT